MSNKKDPSLEEKDLIKEEPTKKRVRRSSKKVTEQKQALDDKETKLIKKRNTKAKDVATIDDPLDGVTIEVNGNKIALDNSKLPDELFVIPLYGKPIMPGELVPVTLTQAWEPILKYAANEQLKILGFVSVSDHNEKSDEDLKEEDFKKYTGCVVRLLHAKSVGPEIHIVCEGVRRFKVNEFIDKDNSKAKVTYPNDIYPDVDNPAAEVELRAFAMNISETLRELLPLNPTFNEEVKQYFMQFDETNPAKLADSAICVCQTDRKERQQVLDELHVLERLKFISTIIKKELDATKLQDKIRGIVQDKINKRQKEFFLREQLSAIQKELGLKLDDKSADAIEFQKRMKKLKPPKNILERFDNEMKKLQVLEQGSAEYAVTRNYLDVLTSIPWGVMAKEKIDLKKARKILDSDHEGLKDVKERIIEFLALGALKGHTKGTIMLFVGPPGVGKTSIGKSIAKALNRPFYRLSLGGVHDESVIKGHRKTYVGAMAGKIVEALRTTKVQNPVIMLDEIDKLSTSYQGDPASALLETLDPEQNNNFMDHFLDERLDLSDCLFICTANSTETIAPPLLDRMDPIRLSGYIAEEKFAIAKNHLIKRALEKASIKARQISLPDEVLRKIIDEYARESGVRSLERAIDKLIRKSAVKIVEGEKKVEIKDTDLEKLLGPAPFRKEKIIKGVGVITGLAWTSVGGATLPIESRLIHKEAKGFTLTGSLGDVMKESAHIAYSFIESSMSRYAPEDKQKFFEKSTIHLHVPEGATPKDGPSAGVTMASSLLSLALDKAPKENFAMTGELSLTGEVLAIGGIREKVIAARRQGIFNIIVPKSNEGDVKELPEEVSSGVTFYYADKYDDVARLLFDLNI